MNATRDMQEAALALVLEYLRRHALPAGVLLSATSLSLKSSFEQVVWQRLYHEAMQSPFCNRVLANIEGLGKHVGWSKAIQCLTTDRCKVCLKMTGLVVPVSFVRVCQECINSFLLQDEDVLIKMDTAKLIFALQDSDMTDLPSCTIPSKIAAESGSGSTALPEAGAAQQSGGNSNMTASQQKASIAVKKYDMVLLGDVKRIALEKWHSEEALVEEINKRSGRPSAGSSIRPFQKKFRTFYTLSGFLHKAARQTVAGAPSAVPAFVLKMSPASKCTICHFSGPTDHVKLHYLLAHHMMPYGDPEILKEHGPVDMDAFLSPIPVPASFKYPTAVRVAVHSLVAAAHYNGFHGELVEYVLASDRCVHLFECSCRLG